MNSMRPKHQVLVQKCYPKFQKGVSEVKPNPSELSYLLYYASTRRSKVQKVAAYLEKRSSKDVPKGKLGNVQVTLHIIRGLIDKSPRDLPLYAPHVLSIFNQILQSKNLNMVEESVMAFQAFCEHEDTTTLTATPEFSKQFEDVVRGYASLTENPPVQSKTTMSAPVSIRWKTAGMRAIKSIASSESIGTDGGCQLKIIIPVILGHLYADGEERLLALNRKLQGEKETAMKRRMSINTVRTVETTLDTEKAAMTDSAADADRIAEEEAGLIAIQSLRQIFTANNRSQIRLATMSLVTFLIEKTIPDRPGTAVTSQSMRPGNWTTTLVEMVTKWTPVQDRFIIVITAVENLVKSPMAEEHLQRQLILATLIEWLLSSSINMIGLSVMDVLLGLIHHILALLQLGGQVNPALPHPEQTEAIDLFKAGDEPGNRSSVMDILNNASFDETRPPSLARQQLLNRLRKCVGSLATHIYYSDQINDIVSAILMRLKPSSSTTVSGTAAAIDKPAAAAQEISETGNLKDDSPDKDEFFSFGTARVTALNAIKDVMVVANRKGTAIGAGVVGRNRISIRTWEGTQWLLRDEDRRVRRAYVEALMTWLRLELLKQDFRIMTETVKPKKRKTVDFNSDKAASTVGPSASSASRSRSKNVKSNYLQLLHLAIYEDALESPDEDENILLLHLLMHTLVNKLGVNAVRSGLPMVRRLQEDINGSRAVGTPKAKINIGSLAHGYFKSCVDAFNFDSTMPGFEVDNEIARRKKHGLWLKGVQVPPQNLDMIIASAKGRSEPISLERAQKESLRPFDSVRSMVEQISISYASHFASPPASPPTSPGRVSTIPKVSTPGASSSLADLPAEFREAMFADWTKESCIAAAQKESARSISPNGSRAGTSRSAPNGGLLSANGKTRRGRDISPASGAIARGAGEDIRGVSSMAFALHPHGDKAGRRRSSAQGSTPATPLSGSSDHGPTLRVDDLKRVLAGGAMADALATQQPRSSMRNASPLRHVSATTEARDFGHGGERASLARRSLRGPSVLSAGSESMVEAEGFESASEGDPEHELPEPQPHPPPEEVSTQFATQLGRRPYDAESTRRSDLEAARGEAARQQPPRTPTSPGQDSNAGSRPTTRGSRPRSSSEGSAEDPEANARALRGQLVPDVVRGSIVGDEGVPPVPPLPSNLKSGAVRVPQAPNQASSRAASHHSARGGTNGQHQHPPHAQHARVASEAISITALPPAVNAPEPGDGAGQHTDWPAATGLGSAWKAEDAPGPVQGITARQLEGARRLASRDGEGEAETRQGRGWRLRDEGLGKVPEGASPRHSGATPPRSVAGSGGAESVGFGSVTGSLGRRSIKGSLKGADGRLVVQALLGSIEVGDVGGKGIGRPPV